MVVNCARRSVALAVPLALFLLGVYIGSLARRTETVPRLVLDDWRRTTSPLLATPGSPAQSQTTGPIRLLSYQPPGNGWNNQRIALENALVLARLLNRTLVVHPLAPHSLGEDLKRRPPHGHRHGYLAYNQMNRSTLLPLSRFVDLGLMSQLVPVVEVSSTHPQFLREYAHLRWRRVCHSIGYGYWVDRHPSSIEEQQWMKRQKFTPNKSWREKCPGEARHDARPTHTHIVRYVSDLANDSSEMLYFEEGTLFGVQLRFTTLKMALAAQQWVLEHMKYSRTVEEVAAIVGQRLGRYNAIHIRRVGHIDKRVSREEWLRDMLLQGFPTNTPVYIATDEPHLAWFRPLQRAGYKLFFAANFSDILSFPHLPYALRQDMLGIHEQIICVRAERFIPSLSSTFTAFIRRERQDIDIVDGLYTDTLHTTWIKHSAT